MIAVFALSCFVILIYLWTTFGGPVADQGRRATASTPTSRRPRSSPTTPTCASRASGRAGDQVEPVERPHARRRSRSTTQYAPVPQRHAGDPAPEDAARRDLRRAHARATGESGDAARRRAAAGDAGAARRSSSTRSCARSTSRRARDLQRFLEGTARGARGPRRRPQRRARQPGAVRRGRQRPAARARPPARAVRRLSRDTAHVLRLARPPAGRARGPRALADDRCSPRPRAATPS